MLHNVLVATALVGGAWLVSFVAIYICLGLFIHDTTDPEVVCR